MLTRLTIRRFKKLTDVSFALGQSVVLIGPNNSGKSTVFQALCLWEIGVINFIAAASRGDLNAKGSVAINRKDLLNSPIADARLLWKDRRVTAKNAAKKTEHIKLEVELEGNWQGKQWKCLAEFLFTNTESFTCRVVSGFLEIKALYEAGEGIRFGFLQPMSGISTTEDKLPTGAIDRRLGEGKTAEVLRNICYNVLYPADVVSDAGNSQWQKLRATMKTLFGADLQEPEFIRATGTIQMEYRENGILYDISAGGRGFQQTLLLLAYMLAHPRTVLLLDEPDAHLEVLRQREIYRVITEYATSTDTQLLIASHSEVVLNEAATTARVVALLDSEAVELNPEATAKMRDETLRHFRKALTDIGWERFYLAKQKGHVLYLEGSTDLSMLISLAGQLEHPIATALPMVNVHYTAGNQPGTAIQDFNTLAEFLPKLKGLALFDKLEKRDLDKIPKPKVICWLWRELENYFVRPAVLLRYAESLCIKADYLTEEFCRDAMQEAMTEITAPIYLRDPNNSWWHTTKLTDEWLDILLPEFFKKIKQPQTFYKRDYHQLISFVNKDDIPDEVVEKLDLLTHLVK